MNENSTLLKVERLKKYFPIKKGFGVSSEWIKAVDDVSFEIKKNSVFALVGESGCGKSTLAKLILRLIPYTAGKILFKNKDISLLKGEDLRGFYRSVQIIFQDPFSSLNPRMRILNILSEPFKIHALCPKSEIKERVQSLLERVGLSSDALYKYPHEFSGGQRQRICIARALTVSPELIVADEPLSALDVSIQAQILNLLQSIKKENGISILFISHDLNVVHYISDVVAVMYLGKIVEMANTDDLFNSPMHPYTKLLLSSAPKLKYKTPPNNQKRKINFRGYFPDNITPLSEDVPNKVLSGCPFHPRCPERFEICKKEMPELKEIKDRSIACHLY